MKLAIITPVRNGEHLIRDTVESVVSQHGIAEGRHDIDYVIWDAQSSDNTRPVAEAAAADKARVVTQADLGMYDGLAKAFPLVTGDVYCYLNAGDTMQPRALDRLEELFADPEVDWLCGLHLYYAASGEIVGARLPFRYQPRMIQRGYYGRGLPTIQQESTFWRAHLMNAVDLDEFATYKLAGDFYLWHSFAQHSELRVAQVALAGFRYHGGHLSDARQAYRREFDRIAPPLRAWDRVRIAKERLLWHLPQSLTRKLAPDAIRYSGATGWETQRGIADAP